MRPYYLDGDLIDIGLTLLTEQHTSIDPVIPVFSRRLSMAADVASVQFSRTVERRIRRPVLGTCGRAHCATAPPPADAGLSKLNSMLASLRTSFARTPSSQESSRCTSIQPGSVDMLGPSAQSPTGSQ
jgi:hypothetical protein